MNDPSYIYEFVMWLLDGFAEFFETYEAETLYVSLVTSVTCIIISILFGALCQMFTSLLGALFSAYKGTRGYKK